MSDDPWLHYLEGLKKIGYEDFSVAEMVNNMSGMPPMLPIFVLDEDDDTKKFINNIELAQEGNSKIIFIHVGTKPKNKDHGLTHDEQTAEKKRLAEELTLNG